MAKVKGFLSQEVEVTRKETPDSPETTIKIPPSWLPLMEAIANWYDRQMYPVWSPFGSHKTRSAKKHNQGVTLLPTVRAEWAKLNDAEKAAWKTSAAFIKRNGYQFFVKDTCYRIKNGIVFPATPNALHQLEGLLMSNPSGVGNVRLQREDVNLMGQVTLSFNYKKTEVTPTGDQPFKAVITMWYFEAGENKTETHTWTAPAGNVAWAAVSETYGTAGRKYYHHRIVFHLDSYNADVYFANFLLKDQALSWTVDYDCSVLPELDDPLWVKTGSVSGINIYGKRLWLSELAGSANKVVYSRTPVFSNPVGNTVEFSLKIVEGTEKDAGNDEYVARVVHSDGTRRVEYLFFQNGIIFKNGTDYVKYHFDTRQYKTYRSFIRGSRLYFYIGRSLVYRAELAASVVQEVSFGHYGRDNYPGESRWGWVKYFQGKDIAPGEDILREGWWIKSGDDWEVDTLYRKKGWTFSPEYHVPYFEVVVL